MARRTVRSGFTLVELLVVIGIIAVLIGILIPTINKARRTANTAKGLANLQQIGLALRIYAGANKDILPPGEVEYPDTGDFAWWYQILNPYLTANRNASENTLPSSQLSKVFRDPNTNGTGVNHYSVHGVAMPDYYNMIVPPDFIPAPAKLTKLKPTFVLITDGAEYANSVGTIVVYPVLLNPDDGYIVFPGYETAADQVQWYLDPTDPWAVDGFPNWGPILPGTNNDTGDDGSFANIRWRQVDPTPGSRYGRTNSLFADGHAETVAQGDFKRAFMLLQPR